MRPSLLDRFRSKIIHINECWQWIAAKDWDGYGQIKYKGRQYKAHRISLVLHGIKLIDGLVCDHICKNPSCVNPKHLRQVTPRENVLFNSNSIQALNRKKTHCLKGHLITGKTKTGKIQRYCRICHAKLHKQFVRRQREARTDWYLERLAKQRIASRKRAA